MVVAFTQPPSLRLQYSESTQLQSIISHLINQSHQSKSRTIKLVQHMSIEGVLFVRFWPQAKGKWHASDEPEIADPHGNLASLPSMRSSNVHQVGRTSSYFLREGKTYI